MSLERAIQFSVTEHFPFTSRFLEYQGYKLHYIDEGPEHSTGATPPPTVILLHGNPTWAFFYRGLIKELSGTFRVIALDYVGCGLSDHPTEKRFRAIDRVEEVEFLYRSLNLKHFSIVMHDWGGAIGTSFLQRHLEHVQGIVYLNTTLTEVESLPLMIKLSANPLFGKLLTQTTPQFLKYLTGPGAVKKLPRYVREGYLFPYRTAARRTAIWDFVSDIPFTMDHPTYHDMQNLADRFASMRKIPMKLVWGLKDPCFHPGMLKKVASHFPHAEICEIVEAGHLVLEDAPDIAFPTIRDFLERASSGTYREATQFYEPRPESNALYRAFQEHVASQPNVAASLVAHEFFGPLSFSQTTFAELDETIRQYAKALTHFGLSPGERVLMLVTPGVEFLAFTYAAMACGAVPCFVDPGVGREKLFRCIQDCDPHVFIGSPKAHVLRLFSKRLMPNLKFAVSASEYFSLGAYGLSVCKGFSPRGFVPKESPEGIAFIAFTSGATGTPKGVLFTNRNVEAQLKIFRDRFGFQAGTKDLPLLPIFSIFSLALGIGSVFAKYNASKPLSLDAGHMVRVIKSLRLDSSFGSPTLWDKISAYCVRHSESLPSLSTILMAGAPVSQTVIEQVARIAVNANASTPYGATEALPVTFVSASELRGLRGKLSIHGEEGTPVGPPIPEVEVRVVKDASAIVNDIAEVTPCDEGEVGEVIVRGTNVSPAYFSRVDANLQSKIKDGESFWHRIGDVGYMRAGSLYYCGRRSHVVETSERVYYPDPVENVFNRHERVKRSALVTGTRHAGVAIEPIPGAFPETPEEKKLFVEELKSLASQVEVTRSLEKFYFFPKFPVDGRHNAKIFRDVLSRWIREQKS